MLSSTLDTLLRNSTPDIGREYSQQRTIQVSNANTTYSSLRQPSITMESNQFDATTTHDERTPGNYIIYQGLKYHKSNTNDGTRTSVKMFNYVRDIILDAKPGTPIRSFLDNQNIGNIIQFVSLINLNMNNITFDHGGKSETKLPRYDQDTIQELLYWYQQQHGQVKWVDLQPDVFDDWRFEGNK